MKKFYLFCILLVLSLTGCTIVETGNVGVEKTFGKVTETPLPQGACLTDQNIARKLKEIELAAAEADRLRVQAQGEADANQILGASLTGNVMQLRMAEIQRDTIVASSKAGATVINGVNATPLIQTK